MGWLKRQRREMQKPGPAAQDPAKLRAFIALKARNSVGNRETGAVYAIRWRAFSA